MTEQWPYIPHQIPAITPAKHYSVTPLFKALMNDHSAKIVEKYAGIFGIRLATLWKTAALKQGVIETIDDCLANRQPDLDIAIWQNVLAFLNDEDNNEYMPKLRDIRIPKLSYDLMISLKLNIGVIILLSLIERIAGEKNSALKFINHNATSVANIGAATDAGDRKEGGDHQLLMFSLEFSEKREWYVTGMRLEEYPDTIVEALPGQPLRTFVSHPVLDTYDLVIQNAYKDITDNAVMIATNYCLDKDIKISIHDLAQSQIEQFKLKNQSAQ